MLKAFLKPDDIFFTEEKSVNDLVSKILSGFCRDNEEVPEKDLLTQYENKINLFPTTIGSNNMIIHLYHNKINKTKLYLIINNKPISINEKTKIKFSRLFFLLTNNKNSYKYSKLKGRIIRVLEDKSFIHHLDKLKNKDDIIHLFSSEEEKIIDIIQQHLIISAKDPEQNKKKINNIQIDL